MRDGNRGHHHHHWQHLCVLVHAVVSVSAICFNRKTQTMYLLHFIVLIPLNSVAACPIVLRTNKSASAAENKSRTSSVQASGTSTYEDEGACFPETETNSSVTGESPNDWDQSAGENESQETSPVSTRISITNSDSGDPASAKSQGTTRLNTSADASSTTNDFSHTIFPHTSSTSSMIAQTTLHHSASATIVSTEMPLVTQPISLTTFDEQSSSMMTREMRVDGVINASFGFILPLAGSVEFQKSSETSPSKPIRTPASLPSVLTVNNYNSTCDVDGDTLNVITGLVAVILAILLVNTIKSWYSDWKNTRYHDKFKGGPKTCAPWAFTLQQ
ncbi:hypothetical protein F5050DRAFT_1805349 [Lentinula boryana]|uniref:Uncharacterized protein n=1 Tax=Lentinula boryana TaxID=40481 RepID=A0ABQ8QKX9_9AGAR|nr:hypothetical protein F5050DRAFT_1805349 [Lentinula boryana]